MVDLSKRDLLRLSGLAGGAVALGSQLVGCGLGSSAQAAELPSSERNTLLASLPTYVPGSEPLASDQMRISFMGTTPLERPTQSCSSVFVELGNGDCFVFDCGAGSTVNYTAMQVAYSKMRKIFLTHLHGDHTSDLTHIYCFGPQGDAKSPLYVWGPSASGVPDPIDGTLYDDGTLNFCRHFREMNRWHTESQSFVPTRYQGAEGDGYDLFATELNWKTGDSSKSWTTNPAIPKPPSGSWIAYENHGVRISYFPAIHDRNGSISYKLEWNGLSMIFTGDTKPSQFLIDNASNGQAGVDVLISEIVVPPQFWAAKLTGQSDTSNPGYQLGLKNAWAVQENSHTPQKAFGYLLNEIAKRGKAPRLAVGTHFQAADETIIPALADIGSWYSAGPVTIASDLMVIDVSKTAVTPRRAIVSDYSWNPPPADPRSGKVEAPKYKDLRASNPFAPMAPLSQFDPWLLANVIDPCRYDAQDLSCLMPYSPPPAK